MKLSKLSVKLLIEKPGNVSTTVESDLLFQKSRRLFKEISWLKKILVKVEMALNVTGSQLINKIT